MLAGIHDKCDETVALVRILDIFWDIKISIPFVACKAGLYII